MARAMDNALWFALIENIDFMKEKEDKLPHPAPPRAGVRQIALVNLSKHGR